MFSLLNYYPKSWNYLYSHDTWGKLCISEKMVCCHLLQALELRNFFTIVKQNTFGKLWRFIQEKEMVYKALYPDNATCIYLQKWRKWVLCFGELLRCWLQTSCSWSQSLKAPWLYVNFKNRKFRTIHYYHYNTSNNQKIRNFKNYNIRKTLSWSNRI